MSYFLRRMYEADSYTSDYNGYSFRKLRLCYPISRSLYSCHSSTNIGIAEMNHPYTETISPEEYSTLEGATVSVTMGGVDITSTAYNNGVITIANVTGDISISIEAVIIGTPIYTPNADYTSYAIIYSKNKNKYCICWAETSMYYRVRYQYNSQSKYLSLSAFADTRYSSTATAYSLYTSSWLATLEDAVAAIQNESTEYEFHDASYFHSYLPSYYVGTSSGKTAAAYNPFYKLKVGGSYFTSFNVISYAESYSENYCSPSIIANDEVILVQRTNS